MHDSCHHEEGELLKLSRGPSLSPPSDVGGMGQGGADVEYGTTVVNSTKASPARTVNWIHAVFLLLAQIVGTGVLELSGNVASIGWIGLAPLLLFAPVNIYTGVLLTRLRALFPSALTLTDLASAIFGPRGATCTALLIYSYMVFACASYMLVLATTLQSMFYDYDLCHPRAAAIAALVLMPFNQARTLHCVSALSVVSVITIGGTVVICIAALLDEAPPLALSVEGAASHATHWIAPDATLGSTLAALCGFCFAYAGQSIYLEIMAEMQQPRQFPLSLLVANGPMVALYVGVSAMTYARRGAATPPILTEVLPFGQGKVAASALLAVHIIVSYVITQQVLCTALHRWLRPAAVGSGAMAQTRRAKWEWLGISAAIALLSWILASALPFFEILTSLIGALQSAPICLGIPALFFLKAASASGTPIAFWERVLLNALLVFTLILVVGGVGGSIAALRAESVSSDGGNLPFACHCRSQSCSAASGVHM